MKLDVHQFAPEEITIKTMDFAVIVEGRHEEVGGETLVIWDFFLFCNWQVFKIKIFFFLNFQKEDPHGFISRNFQRRYLLPDDVKMEHVICELSSDGVLIITVPRVEAIKDTGERFLSITHTGKPALVSTERPHANINAKRHVKFGMNGETDGIANGEKNGDVVNGTTDQKVNGTCEKEQ